MIKIQVNFTKRFIASIWYGLPGALDCLRTNKHEAGVGRGASALGPTLRALEILSTEARVATLHELVKVDAPCGGW